MNTPGHQLYTYPELDETYLQKRIQEEAGPVKTYQAIEWFERRRSPFNTPFVYIESRGIRLNTAAFRAIGELQYVQFGWDNLRSGLLIAPSKKNDSRAYTIRKGTVGGSVLAHRIAERLPFGKYEAMLEDGRLFVKPGEEGKGQ